MDWINMYHTISEGMHRNTIPNSFVVYYDVNHICLNYYKQENKIMPHRPREKAYILMQILFIGVDLHACFYFAYTDSCWRYDDSLGAHCPATSRDYKNAGSETLDAIPTQGAVSVVGPPSIFQILEGDRVKYMEWFSASAGCEKLILVEPRTCFPGIAAHLSVQG